MFQMYLKRMIGYLRRLRNNWYLSYQSGIGVDCRSRLSVSQCFSLLYNRQFHLVGCLPSLNVLVLLYNLDILDLFQRLMIHKNQWTNRLNLNVYKFHFQSLPLVYCSFFLPLSIDSIPFYGTSQLRLGFVSYNHQTLIDNAHPWAIQSIPRHLTY